MREIDEFIKNGLLNKINDFEAVYDYVLETKEGEYAVQECLREIISNYSSTLKIGPGLSPIKRGGLERDVDYLNQIFNKRRRLTYLLNNLDVFGELLHNIQVDPIFRNEIKTRLEGELFEEPDFKTRFWDSLVRLMGNSLGILRGSDCRY